MNNNFRIIMTAVVLVLGGAVSSPSHAESTHYEPLPSDTLAEAVENFVSHDRKMAEVLQRDPLTIADMEEVHELTYTLEIALARINEDLGALPAVLEQVHLASEGDNPHALRGTAEVYLDVARELDR